jgi:hypothetical protein
LFLGFFDLILEAKTSLVLQLSSPASCAGTFFFDAKARAGLVAHGEFFCPFSWFFVPF